MEKEYIKTGFNEIDEALNGGFKRGDLVLLASRPQMGKTSFALNIVNNCSNIDKLKSAIFSLEMSNEYLVHNIFCINNGAKIKNILKDNLNDTDWKDFDNQKNIMFNGNIFVDDTSVITVDEIIEKCKAIKKQYGLDLVVVDYVDLIAPYYSNSVFESNKAMLDYIAQRLKDIAIELNIAVVMLTGLSRKVAYRKDTRPIIDDFIDNQEKLQQLSDVILFMYNQKIIDEPLAFPAKTVDYNESIVEISISKTSHGENKVVKYNFIKDYLRYEVINK